jgi:hypothetical protein
MSFAIYGESNGYVHLVAGDSRTEVVNLFIEDLQATGVDINEIFNVFGVENNQEDKELEDCVEKLIRGETDVLQ